MSALSSDFNEVWAKFSGITFSVPSQLPQSLTHLKNKVAAFFSKQPGGNCGMSFKEIDKVQIKATCMPKIGSAQNLKINQIADDLKQGEVVSNKLIANALVTQKAPSDTPHDDDLD